MRRTYREVEIYELRCHTCHCVAEVPVRSVRGKVGRCPKCDAVLEIRWSEAA